MPAPADGTLAEILKGEGEIVLSDEVLGRFNEGGVAQAASADDSGTAAAPAAGSAPPQSTQTESSESAPASPAARKLAEESGISLAAVRGSGKGGRITKDDVARATAAAAEAAAEPLPEADESDAPPQQRTTSSLAAIPGFDEGLDTDRPERRVPMTRLRASIARRLVEAQHTAAMLTTFNEVDMTAVMALRRKYRDAFAERHEGTRLGFLSFFVRATVEALKRFPAVNASIDDNDIVYHGYYDIGVAVGTERGLVVPVIRDADGLGLAEIERQVAEYGEKARANKLSLEDMAGGTFTISNGGVFGSLMSTPILNPPQTGILGMHKIQERPMVVDGEIVVRPMMYLALSYDHRLIDGADAVRFLVAIKDLLEDPARILLEL